MNEIFSFISLFIALAIMLVFADWFEIYRLKRRVKSYNKRFNANLDITFKDIKRLNNQYIDWYVSMFVPDTDTKMSHWERICAYEESGEYEK